MYNDALPRPLPPRFRGGMVTNPVFRIVEEPVKARSLLISPLRTNLQGKVLWSNFWFWADGQA